MEQESHSQAVLADAIGVVTTETVAPSEVVWELGVPRATVDSWIHRGQVETVHVGSAVRITRESLDRLTASRAERA